MQVCVCVIEGVQRGQMFTLNIAPGSVYGIGRAMDNAIAFPQERSVSSHHAHLSNDNGRVVLTDRGSTNGTFIGGRRVSTCVIDGGSVLRLGRRGPVLQFYLQPHHAHAQHAPEPCQACGAPLGDGAFVCVECRRTQCGGHFDPTTGLCVSCASASEVAAALDDDPFTAYHARSQGRPPGGGGGDQGNAYGGGPGYGGYQEPYPGYGGGQAAPQGGAPQGYGQGYGGGFGGQAGDQGYEEHATAEDAEPPSHGSGSLFTCYTCGRQLVVRDHYDQSTGVCYDCSAALGGG